VRLHVQVDLGGSSATPSGLASPPPTASSSRSGNGATVQVMEASTSTSGQPEVVEAEFEDVGDNFDEGEGEEDGWMEGPELLGREEDGAKGERGGGGRR